MKISNIHKVALGVGLALSASSLMANEIQVIDEADIDAAAVNIAGATDADLTAAYQLTTGQNADTDLSAPAGPARVVYVTTTSGIPNSGFLDFTLSSGGFDPADTYYLARVIDGNDIDTAETQAVGSQFGQTLNGNGDISTLRFQIAADANIGLNEILILTTADPNVGGAADDALNTATAVTITHDQDLSDGDVVSLSAAAFTSGLAAFTAADASAEPVITLDDGLTVTAITAVTSDVDLPAGGVDFETTNYTSTATGFGVAAAALDYSVTLGAGDTLDLSVTGSSCAAVFDGEEGVQWGSTAGGVDSTTYDYGTCTWNYSGDAAAANASDFVAATDDVVIYVNSNAALAPLALVDSTEIDTATWTFSATIDLNDDTGAVDYALSSAADSHTWDASISGDSVQVPYMYAFNGSSTTWSLSKHTNVGTTDFDIAMTVTLQPQLPLETATVYSNYQVGTLAAGNMVQVTGDDIIALLNAPTGLATDGYNDIPAGLDVTRLYHMSVEFIVVNSTDTNDLNVEIQNSAPAGRSTGNVIRNDDI